MYGCAALTWTYQSSGPHHHGDTGKDDWPVRLHDNHAGMPARLGLEVAS